MSLTRKETRSHKASKDKLDLFTSVHRTRAAGDSDVPNSFCPEKRVCCGFNSSCSTGGRGCLSCRLVQPTSLGFRHSNDELDFSHEVGEPGE